MSETEADRRALLAEAAGPYLEMFSRRARLGWEVWGDESLGNAEAAA
jgi:N6-adenosine-specific RNA methylase IME4